MNAVSEAATCALHIHLLGGFRVEVAGAEVPGFRRRSRAAELLKLLALAPGHRMHREEVVDLLWPEFELDVATNNLHRTLHATRHTLELDLASGRRSTYLSFEAGVLTLHAPAGLWVDVEAFELACTIAQAGRDPAAHEAALKLFRGDLLPEDRYADWAAARREALRARCVSVLFDLADLYEASQEPWAAVRVLERLVAAEPAHEEAHVRLMRLYAQAGLRSRALRQYRLLQESLRREVDVEPESSSRRLAEDIRQGRFAAAERPIRCVTPMTAEAEGVQLSAREVEVVGLIARGLTNRAIAGCLGLSTRTVDTHVGRILRKLAVRSRTNAAAWAQEIRRARDPGVGYRQCGHAAGLDPQPDVTV